MEFYLWLDRRVSEKKRLAPGLPHKEVEAAVEQEILDEFEKRFVSVVQ